MIKSISLNKYVNCVTVLHTIIFPLHRSVVQMLTSNINF
ncbi:hypothetical protein BSU04_19840 [Caballeronia sordidicola]|uniref:Uncharacterized protein n=1 Tax=Caballeronia sordidicola TaxID=196367 RepID=A0A226X0B4_CABSO|nr:hypothetical protein BSU04_19840 [Caballeronia sordidicola]